MTVQFECTNGIAVARIDNPPVNAISVLVRVGLLDAMNRAVAAGATRLILTGVGRNFAAGADVREFDAPALPPHLNELIARLADLPIATIAAIKGTALGGAIEIALACRYRIASPGSQMGLPEVKLGIVPGSGGTQRLPRLVGMMAALDLIAMGKIIGAPEAKALGLVDLISDDPERAARDLDDEVLQRALPVADRPAPSMDLAAKEATKAEVRRRSRGQIAPLEAIELVASSVLPLSEGLAKERERFLTLRSSTQARALRHIFFAERAASSRGKEFPASKSEVAYAVVVGGGNMGASIAYALSTAGIAVVVVEADVAGQGRAQANLERLVKDASARGLLSADQSAAVSGRLRVNVGYKDLPAADIAIEAAFEDMEVKRTVFAALQAELPQTTILATNTSYLDVNQLAEGVSRPERFLGLHFFSPAHIMKLLEIVRGDRTSAETLGVAFSLSKRLGKIPVLAGVCDGFIGNRILTRYRHAADVLLLEGALPAQVDAAMRGFGMAMGPYEAQDMSGLDIAYANRKRQNLRHRTDARYVPIVDSIVEDLKRLGRKSGAGWYDYNAETRPVASKDVESLIVQTSRSAGVTRRTIGEEEIVDRILLAMIMEASAILDEGIAGYPADVDVVLVNGYGFPRWRGGPMQYADDLTPRTVAARIEALAAKDALSWSVPPLLARLAEEGQTFARLNARA